jgi:hypothetical protein
LPSYLSIKQQQQRKQAASDITWKRTDFCLKVNKYSVLEGGERSNKNFWFCSGFAIDIFHHETLARMPLRGADYVTLRR